MGWLLEIFLNVESTDLFAVSDDAKG
jgi:hypothetical protein